MKPHDQSSPPSGPAPVKGACPALKKADIPQPPPPPEGSSFAYSHTAEGRRERIVIIHVKEPSTLSPGWRLGDIEGFHDWLTGIRSWLEEHRVCSFWITEKEADNSLTPEWKPGAVGCSPNHPIYKEGIQVRGSAIPLNKPTEKPSPPWKGYKRKRPVLPPDDPIYREGMQFRSIATSALPFPTSSEGSKASSTDTGKTSEEGSTEPKAESRQG